MHVIDVIREGGLGAMAAVGIGALGALLGVLALVSLLGRSRAAFTLGLATLAFCALTAGAGMLGTVYGKYQVRTALAYVNPVDRERIMRIGTREAQSASLVGFGAALLPLCLGALGALGGARLRKPPTRVQGLESPASSTDESAASSMVSLVFLGVAALATIGAFMTYRAPLPPGKYAIPDDDMVSWAVASSADDVLENGAREPACSRLSRDLEPFAGSRGRGKPFATEPLAQIPWKKAADACVTAIIAGWKEPGAKASELTWTRDGLLDSALVYDEAHVRQVEAFVPPTPDAVKPTEPEPPEEPMVGMGSLNKEDIRKVIKRHLGEVQYCYEAALVKRPDLEGKVVVQFVITPSGTVKDVKDTSPTPFPDAAVPACIVARVKKFVFPKPVGGGQVTVNYPFVFTVAK